MNQNEINTEYVKELEAELAKVREELAKAVEREVSINGQAFNCSQKLWDEIHKLKEENANLKASFVQTDNSEVIAKLEEALRKCEKSIDELVAGYGENVTPEFLKQKKKEIILRKKQD